MKKNYKLIRVLPLMVLMLVASFGFAQEVVNTDFGPETGEFTVELDVVPSDAPMNGGVGLSDITVGAWGDMACIVGFHPGEIIRAYNSSGYEYENELIYTAGTAYHITMEVDVPNQSYSVTVTPDGGAATVIATDYGFRTGATVLNTYASYNDTNTAWGGVPGATLDITNFVNTPAPTVVTSYWEDFSDAVSLDQWRPNAAAHPDGTPAFNTIQDAGLLQSEISQVNFWDGQFINFTEHENIIFDITDNTYISFDVKIEPGATYDGEETDHVSFLVSPWGWNDTFNTVGAMRREFLAIQIDVADDGLWHTVTYDISESFGLLDWNDELLENDYSEIQAILVENVIYPGVYAFNMKFDNFKVGAAAVPPTVVTSYWEDFSDAVSLEQWRPNAAAHPDGTPAFNTIQDAGLLQSEVSQVNFWDGQFINFTSNENIIFDITENPYISFDVKIDPGATYDGEETDHVSFLVSPWGWNDTFNMMGAMRREFLAIQIDVADDGLWHTVRYDISESFGLLDWNDELLENDYSEIQAILVENVIYPGVYAFNMKFDNFKVGEAAAPPTVVTSYWEDFGDAVSLEQWRPNAAAHPDGTPAFNTIQDAGLLQSEVSQVNFWDGQFINFTTNENIIFDITENTYISFDVKIEPGATYDGEEVDDVAFLVSPWGWNDTFNMMGGMRREFLAIQKNVADDGLWHTVRYDISESFGLLDWNDELLENDYSEIQAILVENVIYPGVYAFNMKFDNFKVGEAAAPPTVVTTYLEDFEDDVSLDQWRPNGATHADGTPGFDVSQSDGVLHNAVSQVNFWDGQFINFTTHEKLIFDITENPFIAFDVKIEPGATYDGEEVEDVAFLVSPWGWNDTFNMMGAMRREFLAIQMDVPDDGEWHTVTYDISESFGLLDWNDELLENDYSEIQAILVENVIYPGVYAFNMDMDNFAVGFDARPVGVFEVENTLGFSAYPNPVSGMLTLESDDAIESVRVFDAQGRLVATHTINSLQITSLDLSKLQTGLYLVEARSAEKVSTLKVSKQ